MMHGSFYYSSIILRSKTLQRYKDTDIQRYKDIKIQTAYLIKSNVQTI